MGKARNQKNKRKASFRRDYGNTPIDTITDAELAAMGTQPIDGDGNPIIESQDVDEEEDTSMFNEPDSEDEDNEEAEGSDEDDNEVVGLNVGGFEMPELPEGLGVPKGWQGGEEQGDDEEAEGEDDDLEEGGEAVDSEEERQRKIIKQRAPIELPADSKKRKAEELEEEAPRKRVVFSYKKGAVIQYEGNEQTVVQKPNKKEEAGIPFLHSATDEQKAVIDKEQKQGRCLVVYHKPELSFTQLIKTFRKMGVKVKLAYRLRSEPYPESGNVDSFVICNSSEHALKATQAPVKDKSGGFISDCRLWQQRSHVVYIRGVPLKVSDDDIKAFFGKKCGQVEWVHRLEDTGQIGLHFLQRAAVNKALAINNQDVDYNGNKITVSLKISKTRAKKEKIYNNFPNLSAEHWAQLRNIGKVLYHKGEVGTKDIKLDEDDE